MKRLIFLLISVTLNLQWLPAVHAVDTRVIDTVSITWRGAPTPKVSLEEIKRAIIDEVNPRWRTLTTFSDENTEKSIDFTFGIALATPIALNAPLQCDRGDFSTLVAAVRQETYSKLGISDYRNRYLTILAPEAGCVWSGKALIGEKGSKGGVLMLHNNAESFVIAHELGHALGLGHSNLMRCDGKSFEGAWGSSCRAVEYGGAVDLMSNVDVLSPLSTYHQWRMGLMSDSNVKQSWLNESIELKAADQATGIKAVFIRDGRASYWIEYRKAAPVLDYKTGLVVYRTDPPPIANVVSPNPDDRTAAEFGTAVGTDMWMLNLDNFAYASSKAIGSMSLTPGKSITLFSGNITITVAAGSDENEVRLNINRKADTVAPPVPSLTEVSSWLFQDSQIIANNYEDGETAIDYFEIQIADQVSRVNGSSDAYWFPAYLNPLNPPKTLYLKDLPEGSYEFKLRAVDVWGNASAWSESRTTVVDRGHPVIGDTVKVAAISKDAVTLEFSGIRDDGTGLCQTRVVDEIGWVKQRSISKSNPRLSFELNSTDKGKLEAIDCLGNGVRTDLLLANTFEEPSKTRRSGKWSAAPSNFGSGALKCTGACTATISLAGKYSILTGPDAVDVFVSSKRFTRVPAVSANEIRSVATLELGKAKRVVRVSGRDFILAGFLKLDVTTTGKTEFDANAPVSDPTLSDPIQKEMSRFGFNTQDFVPDWVALPMVRGTTLLDPTLDLCGGNYRSEAGREVRRQISVTKVGNPYAFLSSETVKYKNLTAANAAIEELKARYAACVSAGGGTENGVFTKYEFKDWSASTKGLVDEKSRVLVHAKIGAGLETRTLLGFYQFRGEYFTGLYVVSPKAEWFSQEEMERWSQVAKMLESRLDVKSQA